ncbi:nitrate reductase molybdenum cofactor assembly chaperone [Dermatophilaceae bacterium Sec6.4]|nr:nitrate reductase molybdenum cofactor assembly chaperone [Actinomycetota bacterium]
MRRRAHAKQRSDEQLTIVWQAASLLLDYPDEVLLRRLPMLRIAVASLPDAMSEGLGKLISRLESTPLDQLQCDYVETFDNRRRCNLYLTYFAHGDTRKRGLALLRFKQTFQRSGFDLAESELPDHLCVVLEYAATIDREAGRALMLDHRAGLELLRLSLQDLHSPWSGAVDAICATFPPLGGDERDAVRRLAAEGPPEEEVGLAPFATPEFSPSAAQAGAPAAGGRVSLPMPSFRGASR